MSDYAEYNGFYSRRDCAQVVHALYEGQCQVCSHDIAELSDMDIGHRVPQSKAEIWTGYFPQFDIDNLLNLQPEHRSCNRSKSNSHVPSPTLLQASVDHAARLISSRLPRILRDLGSHSAMRGKRGGQAAAVQMPAIRLHEHIGERRSVDLSSCIVPLDQPGMPDLSGHDVFAIDQNQAFSIIAGAYDRDEGAVRRAPVMEEIQEMLEDAFLDPGFSGASIHVSLADGRILDVSGAQSGGLASDDPEIAWCDSAFEQLMEARNKAVRAKTSMKRARGSRAEQQDLYILGNRSKARLAGIDLCYLTPQETVWYRYSRSLEKLEQGMAVGSCRNPKGTEEDMIFVPNMSLAEIEALSVKAAHYQDGHIHTLPPGMEQIADNRLIARRMDGLRADGALFWKKEHATISRQIKRYLASVYATVISVQEAGPEMQANTSANDDSMEASRPAMRM